jgi:hypothetical protein
MNQDSICMIYPKIIIALWLIPHFTFSQHNENKEQMVFAYFMENLFYKDYPDILKVEFSGYTEEEMSKLYHYKTCFADSEKLRNAMDSTAHQKVLPKIKIAYTDIKNITIKQLHPNSRRTKIYVLQKTPVNNHYYLVIQVIKPIHFVNYYLSELDNSGKIMRWCRTGEII